MKIPQSKSYNKARIEIIPMIDIMFFLLATIMLATIDYNKQKMIKLQQNINLPTANNAKDVNDNKYSIIIDSNNQLFFENNSINIAGLDNRLRNILINNRDISINIVADSKSSHGTVVNVIDIAKKLGIDKFAIITK